MNESETCDSWFARRVEEEAKKDVISYSDRVGNVFGVICGVLVMLYFVAHQTWATGFFTETFGTSEMLLFYGSLIVGIVSSALKVMYGRKNPSRLFDVFGLIFVVAAISWLLATFPFDFTYFANVLPEFLRFLVQWISNDIARVVMVLAIIVTLVMAVYSAVFYVFVRKELLKPTPRTAQ